MMQPSASQTESQPVEDARELQAKLYREIGISAVAAALLFTTRPDPAPRAAVVDEKAQPGYTARHIAA